MAHTPGPLTVAETAYGYSIYRTDGWTVGHATQRDCHPVHGGGASRDEALSNATLWAAAPDLLALAHQYADECAECRGTGLIWDHPRDPQDAKEHPCPDCADIRAVIAKAVGA